MRSLRPQVAWDRAVKDMCAAGGGSFSWLAATQCRIGAAVTYYDGNIMRCIDELPKCPIMVHSGERAEHILPETAVMVERGNPGVQVFMYDVSHGFNSSVRTGYDAECASLAQERTSEFISANLTAAPAV